MEKIMHFLMKKRKEENGAIVVEATISLTAFIFAILIVLQLIDICYVQAKMAVAINSAAKEMSQYSYLYTAVGLDEHMSGSGGKSSELMQSFSELIYRISGEMPDFLSNVSAELDTAGSAVAGDSIAKTGKNLTGMALAKQSVKKNLKTFKGDNADSFLRRNHVVNGLSGLNFLYTSFLSNENQDEIDVIVTYEVEVLKLLDTRFTFNFVQRARCKSWGKGVSLKDPSSSAAVTVNSIWDAGNLSRGTAIINNEKKNFAYTSSNVAYHAYNPSGNEFVRIRSLDTNTASYSKNPQKDIKNALNSSFNIIYSEVSELGPEINVKNSAGKDTVVTSDETTRTYRIVLVVPDNADMETVNAAAREFESERASLGDKVTVEVKSGYGSPTPEKTPEPAEDKPAA